MKKFDYKTLKVGDRVETPYGEGVVVDQPSATKPDGEIYIKFDDGSGCGLYEATKISEGNGK